MLTNPGWIIWMKVYSASFVGLMCTLTVNSVVCTMWVCGFEALPKTAYFHNLLIFKGNNGAPDRIRTCDLCLRRAALYPAELRVPNGCDLTLIGSRLAYPNPVQTYRLRSYLCRLFLRRGLLTPVR